MCAYKHIYIATRIVVGRIYTNRDMMWDILEVRVKKGSNPRFKRCPLEETVATCRSRKECEDWVKQNGRKEFGYVVKNNSGIRVSSGVFDEGTGEWTFESVF